MIKKLRYWYYQNVYDQPSSEEKKKGIGRILRNDLVLTISKVVIVLALISIMVYGILSPKAVLQIDTESAAFISINEWHTTITLILSSILFLLIGHVWFLELIKRRPLLPQGLGGSKKK